jgi:competence ComEA-like helix-hairpin-helix protein
MHRTTVAAVAMLALGFAVRVGPVAARQAQALTPQSHPADFTKAAEEVIDRVCAACHGWDVIGGTRRTTEAWDKVLSAMVDQGARATASEMALVRGYVLWSYGRVAVNAASAEELAAVLGIEPVTARSIVDDRKQHGNFKNADDLARVPGLDRKVLEAQADALQFEVTRTVMR